MSDMYFLAVLAGVGFVTWALLVLSQRLMEGKR
jgi:hypothetical protein